MGGGQLPSINLSLCCCVFIVSFVDWQNGNDDWSGQQDDSNQWPGRGSLSRRQGNFVYLFV